MNNLKSTCCGADVIPINTSGWYTCLECGYDCKVFAPQVLENGKLYGNNGLEINLENTFEQELSDFTAKCNIAFEDFWKQIHRIHEDSLRETIKREMELFIQSNKRKKNGK